MTSAPLWVSQRTSTGTARAGRRGDRRQCRHRAGDGQPCSGPRVPMLSSPAAIAVCSSNQSANSAPSVPSVGPPQPPIPGRHRGFERSPACDDVDAPVNPS